MGARPASSEREEIRRNNSIRHAHLSHRYPSIYGTEISMNFPGRSEIQFERPPCMHFTTGGRDKREMNVDGPDP